MANIGFGDPRLGPGNNWLLQGAGVDSGVANKIGNIVTANVAVAETSYRSISLTMLWTLDLTVEFFFYQKISFLNFSSRNKECDIGPWCNGRVKWLPY